MLDTRSHTIRPTYNPFQCVHVPYTSLTVHLSYNQKEIDSVTLFSKSRIVTGESNLPFPPLCCLYNIGLIFEVMGTLVGIGVYTVSYYVFVGSESKDDCSQNTRTYDTDKASGTYNWV